MDLEKTFATDSDKEKNGVWAPIGDGAELLVARADNPAYQREIQRLLRPHRAMARMGNISEDIAEKAVIEAMAKTVLLGWKGLKEAGKEIKYSTEKAVEILTKYKDFRELVSSISADMANYKAAADEDAVGNSKAA